MADSSSSSSISGLPGVSQIAEQLMQQQYAWGQAQFAQNSQLTDQVVGDLMNTYSSLSGMGSELMSTYSKDFEPEYQNLINDANNYSSQARIQQAMGAAESNVAQDFNGQRNAALTDLQSFGIDPSSGRYAQLDAAERTQQAAAQAGAGFQAEQATEATGRGLRSEALQLGSVMPSQATAAYNAAAGAATAGENATLANSQEGVNMMGSPIQWGSLAQSLKTAGSSSSKSSPSNQGKSSPGQPGNSGGPNDPLDEHESSAQSDPNWAGTGSQGSQGSQGGQDAMGGPPNAKVLAATSGGNSNSPGGEDDQSQGDSYSVPDSSDFSSGDDFSGGDDSMGMAGGGAIPFSKSPSHGRVTDDVHAKNATTGDDVRLNAGEFVIPRHTVAWKGEKFFQDLIKKSKDQRAGAGAKPTLKPSLPHRGAIPMGA